MPTDSRTPPRIYLAGPDVFLPEPDARGRDLKAICAEFGAEGLFPLDASVSGPTASMRAAAIRAANMDLIRRCDAVVANMQPFRGPGMDGGTAWEMGFATALGKPVVGYTPDPRPYADRVRASDPDCVSAPDGWRDGGGLAVEDMGLSENLMMAAGARSPFPDARSAIRHAAALLSGTDA